ncbi:DUF2577 family protein [uncultured Flavonifractor sp.]|uniref:DUF2577 family protein n=1 Tax=uncultured Flavonifractor sp. TaxID=1193534 RepID=UPI00261CF261|nr:DUF2577 family protein [uncultured Flavonifractor sp.]
MNLAETIYMMNQKSQKASQLTDLKIGTVTAVDPLEITINTAMAPLKAGVLLLTESVIEKKIPVLTHKHYISTLNHTHTAPEGATGPALTGSYLGEESLVSEGFNAVLQDQDIVCWENGQPLPIEDGFIILNRALEVGDKVLLLRVQNGQRFIILSRVFEEAT